jgi:hypothetical protein
MRATSPPVRLELALEISWMEKLKTMADFKHHCLHRKHDFACMFDHSTKIMHWDFATTASHAGITSQWTLSKQQQAPTSVRSRGTQKRHADAFRCVFRQLWIVNAGILSFTST